MSGTHAQPVGGPILTKGFRALAAVFLVGAAFILARLVFGLGRVTAMNDGYPWGVWIAFDVVTGTALACGGYAVALLVYILNRGRYHPLVRPAILTSVLGYSLAGVGVALDVGRWWNLWRVPLFFWRWNLDSVLLEVALCIMAYVLVLWIELSPALLEQGRASAHPRLRAFSRRALPLVDRSLLWIVALGLVLPTMHQSSLGALMLIAGPRLHPLWNTGLMPLLFLISCLGMGYAAVVFESALSSVSFRRPLEMPILSGLAGAMVPVSLAYVVLRLVDLAARGQLGALIAFDRFSVLVIFELALAFAPVVMLRDAASRRRLGTLVRAAMLLMLAGGLYRFDAYLVAFRPGDHWSYFPSVGELLTMLGLVAGELMLYIAIVRLFPILSANAPRRTAAAAAV